MGRASTLDGLQLAFREPMVGSIGDDRPLRFDVTIRIADLGRFLHEPQHPAELTGTVTCPELGGTMPIRDGRFHLFAVDPRSGVRQLLYFFRFTAAGGDTFCLSGHKDVRDDPGLDIVQDMTLLFTKVYRGEDEHAPLYGSGELRFPMTELPSMLASMKVEGARGWTQELAARVAFASLAWGQLRDEYLDKVRLFYDTRYENLVAAGRLRAASADVPFFLVSGVHDKGFPWGDGELFWDVLLAVSDGQGGYRRYAITDRVLEGLHLDIDAGTYRYAGPLFLIGEGYAASFSQMRKCVSEPRPSGSGPGLTQVHAEIAIDFQAAASQAVAFPFPLVPSLVRRLSSTFQRELRATFPGENALGIFITPHLAAVRNGSIRIDAESWQLDPAGTAGECEQGAFRNVKEPTLLYGYLCALQPESKTACVQIQSRTFRNERQDWVKDRLDAAAGAVIRRTSSAEIRPREGAPAVTPIAAPLRKIGDPIVEVNNDHFPTAVFQRRIVEVQDASGARSLALEEDVRAVRLEAVNCDRRTTVAAIRGEDKFQALDRVLEAAGFDGLLEEKWRASGKPRAAFSIAVKPNFMFSYNKRDRSTYTDPELVGHLVRRLRGRGFEAIRVVEAQSTYGQFFDKRSVREMAEYLGYEGCEVVDMTLDADEQRVLGPHLKMHPVSRVWREADFRISFAKNKTHSYAYYTLTLKNMYGALPLANKFREYHCGPGIYHPAIEYLAAFPLDFCLIDAWLSADGPFGVFADPEPNETRTIIGGADPVAVDWIGASKMGIDPMLSKYMQLAVNAFGKPEINLIGDANPYRPWLNVPPIAALLAHRGMDAEYHFGNLLYSVSAQMDDTHFHHLNNTWYIKLLRTFTVPLRRAFFLRTGEARSLPNKLLSRLFYHLGY